ncbi:MAG TPA: ROK family protein [Candidatus Dormibacteraeota bacterium]|jgi:glucokinase
MTAALIGVDLGGTSIRAAVATGEVTHGEPVHRDTPSRDGPAAVLDAVADCARQAAAGAPIRGLAIGIPGPIDPRAGVVHDAPNMSGWNEVPAAAMLTERLGCPVVLSHDAAAAGYAELKAGAGRGARHLLFITVSTGIGGALFIDGDLYDGATGSAGEVGHTPISDDGPPCGQGHPGCLEGTSSGTAIASRARAELAAGTVSSLSSLDGASIDARAIVIAANAGDELSLRVFHDAGHALGRALGGFINVLSPDAIVIGGGLIHAGDLLLEPARHAVTQIAFEIPARRCKIVTAALGTDAGLIGAVAWAVRSFSGHPVAVR